MKPASRMLNKTSFKVKNISHHWDIGADMTGMTTHCGGNFLQCHVPFINANAFVGRLINTLYY